MKRFLEVLKVVLVVVIVVGGLTIAFLQDYYVNEVEKYSIAMEITHTEESTYYIKNYGEKTTRTFYLRGDDKAIAVEVDEETCARFAQGDWVEVELRILENPITRTIKERAEIIGEME